MTEIVNPLSSRLDAQNNLSKLRQLILNSSQTAFLLLIPLASFLIIFGRDLLAVWVGSSYTSAYGILVLLTLGLGAAATQCCIQSMLFGIERHKALIWFRLGEGLSVAILGSVVLKLWGLEAFAALIMVTLLTTSLILVPRHLCRILGLSLRRYLFEGILKPSILAVPAVVTYVMIQRVFQIAGWRDLILTGTCGAIVYAVTLCVASIPSSRSETAWYTIGILRVLAQRFLPALHPHFRPSTETLTATHSQIEW